MDTGTKDFIDGLIFPEGPRWHDNKLFFSDMNAGKVLSVDLNKKIDLIVDLPGPCSGLGWRPDGRLLIVSMIDRRLLCWDGSNLSVVSDLYNLASYHCNDMVVDKKGYAYIGNFGFDLGCEPLKTAEIIRVDLDGKATIVADNLKFPNGMVITPDGSTLIVGESYGACLTAFDIDKEGTLSTKRNWATVQDSSPDGICLDEKNGIWVASPATAEVFRVLEGGTVTHRIPIKTRPYACMLGGEDRKTLFIATSGMLPKSGKIEYVRVEVPGTGLP